MLFLMFAAIFAMPFGLYFLGKYIIRQFKKYESDLAERVLGILRFINIFFQPVLAVFLFASIFFDSDLKFHCTSDVVNREFYFFYFAWPVSCAIYNETKNSKWEWAIFWISTILILPWAYMVFAFNAE